ncbi:hypothetical protein H6F67_13505 [Microcoleus sp. FACHB-1515]|uniref:hypothetical protein n=1 Tax=Cyanophyceae TaxID=3028117 RepID=UPI001687085D|nr:hypothetical protein [Microcoleus sp. FACHB-1515]MBD2090867.1 hypothetical protein [Microcoleus sp. FACHB-1515]
MTDSKTPFDYRLRLQVPADSSDRVLLEYLKAESHPTYLEKEMVLAALRMCWLPLAYEQSDASCEEVQRLAHDAILRLREQIQYLAAIAGISTSVPAESAFPQAASVSSPRVESVRLSRPAIASAPGSEDGYEEDLFGDD